MTFVAAYGPGKRMDVHMSQIKVTVKTGGGPAHVVTAVPDPGAEVCVAGIELSHSLRIRGSLGMPKKRQSPLFFYVGLEYVNLD